MRTIDIDNVNHLRITAQLKFEQTSMWSREITSNVCKYLEIEFQIRTTFLTNDGSCDVIGQRVMESVSSCDVFKMKKDWRTRRALTCLQDHRRDNHWLFVYFVVFHPTILAAPRVLRFCPPINPPPLRPCLPSFVQARLSLLTTSLRRFPSSARIEY